MSTLDKIKEAAEQMPDSPEKEQAMQAYANLKLFETIADSFEQLINRIWGEGKVKHEQNSEIRKSQEINQKQGR